MIGLRTLGAHRDRPRPLRAMRHSGREMSGGFGRPSAGGSCLPPSNRGSGSGVMTPTPAQGPGAVARRARARRSLIEQHVVEPQLESAGLGTPAEEDPDDVAAVAA